MFLLEVTEGGIMEADVPIIVIVIHETTMLPHDPLGEGPRQRFITSCSFKPVPIHPIT